MSLRPALRRALAALLATAVLVLVLAGAGALWIRHRMKASLPRLDGSFTLAGLGAKVTVARDALGTPTITGASRLDVARATGWMHAQDRFFQMDLLRRRGAGELAELFGSAAVGLDKEARLHGFRQLAGQVLARAQPADLALLKAYSEGVNAGLAALPDTPWEYAVLRMAPRAWEPTDTILVGYAMFEDLQDTSGRYVQDLSDIRDAIGPVSLAFFAPLESPDDAALDGSTATPPPMPELEIRPASSDATTSTFVPAPWAEREVAGSNSLAVAGRFTADGGAVVANDMHLRLGIPNIWYRMALRWPGHEATGVTLPGTPLVIAGSNGQVAWGFTNSGAGTGDVARVDPTISPTYYHGADGGLKEYTHRHEAIAVRGGKAVEYDVTSTIWGPVIGVASDGRQLVYRWTGDDPAAANLGLVRMEDARTVREALDIAHTAGIPAENFVVGDTHGDIGWTVAGALPNRVGYDGRLPVSYNFGDRRWDGLLPGAQVPELVSPPEGRIWTANNRTVGGAALTKLGDSGYAAPARARQIRDDLDQLLAAGHPVKPADLLAIQLDDRGLLLQRWRGLLVQTLKLDTTGKPSRAALLYAAQAWDGTAGTGAIGYGVVKSFRLAVFHRILDPIFSACTEHDPQFDWGHINVGPAVDRILKERPKGMLEPAYATWDDLLLAASDDVAAEYAEEHRDPRTVRWGQINIAQIQHPFARLLPGWARGLLELPADPLAGDTNMPRIQGPAYGASERFAVNPGHEDQGIFHMPGGASSNPLSPYFAAGHEAWVHGDPTPFLPGRAEHSLELAP